MSHNVYIYLIIMATVTLAIRILPLTLVQKQFKSQFVKSFLYYVPYVTLAVMTFPAILTATNNMYAAFFGFLVAVILAWCRKSLFQVSITACAVVFILELIL